MRPFGLTLQRDPELYLRLLSILSLAAATIVIYTVVFRHSRSWWSATAAATFLGASPLMLFFAFEARVWAFATLATVVYVALLSFALTRPRPVLLVAGALLGVFLGHLYIYIVCLFAGLFLAALVRFATARERRELLTVGAFAIPGAITAASEALFFVSTYPSTGFGFPLYNPQPFTQLLSVTLSVFSSTGLSSPPLFLRALSMILLGATLAVVSVVLARSPLIVLPAGAAAAVVTILILGATRGYMIVPRYEVPLIGALICSLGFAFTKEARICLTLLAVSELLVIPFVVRDISLKGNGKAIAQLIGSSPKDGTGVIVQHVLRRGYPDPLHTFVVSFYLDRSLPVCELPTLRDVRAAEGLLPYFDGGKPLWNAYASTPQSEWEERLRTIPWLRIWLVTPVPRSAAEAKQSEAFRKALLNSGFRLAHAKLVGGYPMTQAGLFERAPLNVH